ncbi:MAG TPA: class III poly(R)-hydroxyalkanoic acid synthase subunit PhaC [Gammaproteobacteria bacterium]|jgi:polyhydroxyalkanoate synthase subunit PhaC|nr:class III poly(R)-hydroxyalkanoic acid synthase subunit PhaC [Gammaproteobacteria bacterium]HCZ48040.1 class III poly(R)-hydroxyalkanoic acid synthase subunit PhaC [Gammaproteobacteria bacterium]MCH77478.1 class III poly(R)-hydroxyalkanoic acid synthase subunit PhaC [Gammaproteobacteria bacterium]
MTGVRVTAAQVRAERARVQAWLDAEQPVGPWPTRERERIGIEGKAVLRFYPGSNGAAGRPLLLVYSLVNRPDVLDLAPGHSFIEALQRRGHPVYLMDWGRPDASDAGVSMADYVNGYLIKALQQVRQRHARRTVDVVGICQGGVLALCLASLAPRAIHRLATLVTPVDFHTPGDLLAGLARSVAPEDLVAEDGNLPGHVLGGLFALLRPLRAATATRTAVAELSSRRRRERLLRLLDWQADYPDQAGRAWREFVTTCYRDNQLRTGTLQLDGHVVDLRRLGCPVLNVYARADHMVPVAAARALGQMVEPHRYHELAVDGGHVGVFAGRRGLQAVSAAVSDFFLARNQKSPADARLS